MQRAVAEGWRRTRRWSLAAATGAVTLVTAGGGIAVATALPDSPGPSPRPVAGTPVEAAAK